MTVQLDLGQPENVQFHQLTLGIREYNADMERLSGSPGIMVSKIQDLCMPDGFGSLVDCSEHSLAVLIRMTVEPGKWKKVENKDTGVTEDKWFPEPSIPRNLIKAYMDAKLWHGIPVIKGVTQAPMIKKDFTTRWETGYEPSTQFWVKKGIERDDSLVMHPAFDVRDVFNQFPFSDQRLVADAIAAALTPLLVTAIEGGVPALIVSARKPGSGKTELAKFCSIMGGGGKQFTVWKNSAEFAKTMHSFVSDDKAVVLYDNVKSKIDSPDLESLITARQISVRKFYSQTTVSTRSNTVWYFTANGAVVSEDMVRRSILILLDKDSTPSLKPWTGAVVPWVERNEAALVTYMCHMIEQWQISGCVPGSLSDINFPEWARVVSGILECAGIGGLFEAREDVEDEAIQTDEDGEIAVVEAIAAVMGGGSWTAADLWEKVNDAMEAMSNPKAAYVKRWLDVEGKKSPTMSVGSSLHKLNNKKFDDSDMYIEVTTGRARKKFYQVVTKSGVVIPAAISSGTIF